MSVERIRQTVFAWLAASARLRLSELGHGAPGERPRAEAEQKHRIALEALAAVGWTGIR